MHFVNGPLDGLETEVVVTPDQPFAVFELAKIIGESYHERPGLFALYRLEFDRLVYVETKTREQLDEIRSRRSCGNDQQEKT